MVMLTGIPENMGALIPEQESKVIGVVFVYHTNGRCVMNAGLGKGGAAWQGN